MKFSRFSIHIFFFLFSVFSLLNVSVAQEKNTEAAATTRLWNLQDADILSVINEVSQETGKNFVVDPRVSGKITLISSKPLRQNEVYQVFLSVLGILGFSAIPSGNVIKIVPNMESGEQSTPVLNKISNAKGEEVIVRVIPLENVSSTQLIPILRPMLPQWSNISAYTPGNVLIVLGRASNLDRIMTVINDVDKAANSGVDMIPLKRASAAQVAVVLNNLQSAARASGETSGVSVAVDERSNSILLSGLQRARMRMRTIIAHLDQPSKSASFGNTEVVYLRYLQAKTFAPLLGKIAQNILGKSNGSGTYESTTVSSSPTSTTTTANVAKDINVNTTNIQAEPNTNALIITAPPTLMVALKQVVAKLDIRPAQVAVEGIIAEVDEGNDSALGIQWSGSQIDRVAGTGNSSLVTGIFQPGVYGILPGTNSIQAVLKMLQTLKGTDILSTPSIMVLDNQPATIEIGQAISIQTGSYTTQTGAQTGISPTPFNTTDYKNITLKLDVTPQINLGSSVRLKIALKNDTVAGAPPAGNPNPPINTSSIKNVVLVNDGDVLVLAGLIQNSTVETLTKIPILGDIPVVGKLFQRKELTLAKKNLMVFIKPTIVHSPEEGMLVSDVKYHIMKRAQANHKETLENLSAINVRTNMLPPWKNPKDLPLPFSTTAR